MFRHKNNVIELTDKKAVSILYHRRKHVERRNQKNYFKKEITLKLNNTNNWNL